MLAIASKPISISRAERSRRGLVASTWEAAVYSARDPFKETSNEDAAVVIPVADGSVVAAVADGCGGMRGGERAARLATQSLARSLRRCQARGTSRRDAILEGIDCANQRIRRLRMGAACTLAVAEWDGNHLRTYHVGDAMIMVVSKRGKLRYRSLSHSPVSYAIEAGLLDEGEALFHEDRHLVSNVVGHPQMKVEMGPTIALAKTDRVLIGSDGLFDNLSSDEVIECLRRGKLGPAIGRLAQFATIRMSFGQRAADLPAGQPCKPDDLTLIGLCPRA